MPGCGLEQLALTVPFHWPQPCCLHTLQTSCSFTRTCHLQATLGKEAWTADARTLLRCSQVHSPGLQILVAVRGLTYSFPRLDCAYFGIVVASQALEAGSAVRPLQLLNPIIAK
jgi:hypothetical protein